MPDEPVTAKTREGYDLPVIDVTNPRFAVPDGPNARALHNAFLAGEWRRRFIPPFIMRLMLRSAARKYGRRIPRRAEHLCDEARRRQPGAAL
jgi:hypothetical protein